MSFDWNVCEITSYYQEKNLELLLFSFTFITHILNRGTVFLLGIGKYVVVIRTSDLLIHGN